MKLAIIGSRSIQNIDIEDYIPSGVTEIVSGGARGVDRLARIYAAEKNLPLTEFLPQYHLYGRVAPLKRNEEIAQYADAAIVFWDGASKGTSYTVECFRRYQKDVRVFIIS